MVFLLTSLHILGRYFHVSFKIIYSRSKRVKMFFWFIVFPFEQCLPMLFPFLQGRQCYPCPIKEGTKSQREVKWLTGSPTVCNWQSLGFALDSWLWRPALYISADWLPLCTVLHDSASVGCSSVPDSKAPSFSGFL